MADLELGWRPNHPPRQLDVGDCLIGNALKDLTQCAADLVDFFPLRNQWTLRSCFGDGWFAMIIDFANAPGMTQLDPLVDPELSTLEAAASANLTPQHEELRKQLPDEYFSFSRFSYVGPCRDETFSWPHMYRHFGDWLATCVGPEVLSRNRARVLRAIPQPPQFKFSDIARALWVLECDETAIQGTAFALEGHGLVTCQHVLGPATIAFQSDAPSKRHPVTVAAGEQAIDLAILTIDCQLEHALLPGSADSLRHMDHVAVCGYPNFRLGDTGTLVPGLVVGFRTISSIRRILTNAPVISGVSGGPVLGADGRVVGIAVTGAERMEHAQETENHGIIPIEALRFLRSDRG